MIPAFAINPAGIFVFVIPLLLIPGGLIAYARGGRKAGWLWLSGFGTGWIAALLAFTLFSRI